MAVVQHINYNSDFVVPVIFYVNKKRASVPVAYPWHIKVTTGGTLAHNAFIASFDGKRFTNCALANESLLLVMVRGHNLGIGKVEVTFEAELPNPLYSDGVMRVSLPMDTEYELWDKATDYVVPTPEVEAAIGYIVAQTPTPEDTNDPTDEPLPRDNDVLLVQRTVGNGSGLGENWDSGYTFGVIIANFSEYMLDNSKYRLAYMYTRKSKGRGRRWVVPMFGALLKTNNAYDLYDCFMDVAGKETNVHIPFVPSIMEREKKNNHYISQTNSTRMKVGVALFKKGAGNPGWWRCSNIIGVEYYLGNIDKDKDIKSINTRYISE